MTFESVYKSEMPSVYALLFHLGAPSSDIADLAHEVFITAMKRWNSYDPTRPVRPWLLGITWRVLSDFRAKKGAAVLDQLPELATDSNPDASLEAREAKLLVQRALTKLDETKRAAFAMYELEGLTVAEISDAMGVPVQTTYSRLRVAREEFSGAVRRLQGAAQ